MQKLLPIFENVLFWAVLILFLFIPLYLKFPLFGVGGSFVSIRLEDILIASTYIIWGIYLILSGKIKDFKSDKLIQLFLVFFFIGAVSIFSSSFLTKTTGIHLGIFHWARRIEIMMLLPLVMSIINRKRQAYVYLAVLTVALFIVNFYALGQRFLHFPAVSTTNSELSKGIIYYINPADRVISTFGGHYDLAAFLVIALTLITATIFFMMKKNRFIAIWLGILELVSGWVLIITAARLSFVAAISGIIAALILTGKKKFIGLIILLVIVILAFPSQLRDRFVSTFTINVKNTIERLIESNEETDTLNIPTLPIEGPIRDKNAFSETPDIVPGEPVKVSDLGVFRSFEIRIRAEWPRAIRALIKNPFLGTGYSSIGLATDNDILRSLGEVGILGTWAFTLVLYGVVKKIMEIYRHNGGFLKYLSAGSLAMILAFVVNSLFIDVFEASKTASLFWMILGINLGLAKLEGKNA